MTKEKRYYEKQRFAQRRMWMLLATILFITIGSAVFGSSFSERVLLVKIDAISVFYNRNISIRQILIFPKDIDIYCRIV